mmetsp:Transcript_21632/g.37143  ORF Transcript_21632/g.37143 Transcript_21632/m.37143 type:complete len:296 (+) Transcript_21632:368-1255(+)
MCGQGGLLARQVGWDVAAVGSRDLVQVPDCALDGGAVAGDPAELLAALGCAGDGVGRLNLDLDLVDTCIRRQRHQLVVVGLGEEGAGVGEEEGAGEAGERHLGLERADGDAAAAHEHLLDEVHAPHRTYPLEVGVASDAGVDLDDVGPVGGVLHLHVRCPVPQPHRVRARARGQLDQLDLLLDGQHSGQQGGGVEEVGLVRLQVVRDRVEHHVAVPEEEVDVDLVAVEVLLEDELAAPGVDRVVLHRQLRADVVERRPRLVPVHHLRRPLRLRSKYRLQHARKRHLGNGVLHVSW